MPYFGDGFDYNNNQYGNDAGGGYVNHEVNEFDFTSTSNIDPALTAMNDFALPTANPLRQFQAPAPVPQYAPSFSSDMANWPRPPNPDACYHPSVGWYLPLGPTPAPSVGYASPAFASQPLNMNNQLPVLTPMAPLTSSFQAAVSDSAPPSMSTGQKRKAGATSPSRDNSRTRSQKRKYGPATYLDEQANKRAKGDNGAPSLSHRQSVSYGKSPASRKQTPEQRSVAKEAKAARAPCRTTEIGLSTKKIGQLNAAIVQSCVCPAARQAKANHVKRAPNAFFVFRSEYSAKWRAPKGKGKGKQNEVANVSAAAGLAWRALSAADKAPYEERARQEKEEHKLRHPDYQYDPSKGIEAKFGKPDCKCGAYQANTAEWRSNHGDDGPDPIQEAEENEDEDEDNITVARFKGPMTRSRSRSLSRSRSAQGGLIAPVAQLQQTPYFNQAAHHGQYDHDLPMTDAPLRTGFDDLFTADELAAQPQVHSDFDTGSAPLQGHSHSPTLRRSPRAGSKSTHYEAAPVAVDAAFWETFINEDLTIPAKPKSPSPKRRPSPITTTRKESIHSTIPKYRASDLRSAEMSTPSFDGPAARTRSKSVSVSPSSRKASSPKNSSRSPLGRKASTPKAPTPRTPPSRKTSGSSKASTPKTSPPKLPTVDERETSPINDNDSMFTSPTGEQETSPVNDNDSMFNAPTEGSRVGIPKSAASSKASPKTTTTTQSGLVLPKKAALASPVEKVASGRTTRSRSRESRGRSRKRS